MQAQQRPSCTLVGRTAVANRWDKPATGRGLEEIPPGLALSSPARSKPVPSGAADPTLLWQGREDPASRQVTKQRKHSPSL